MGGGGAMRAAAKVAGIGVVKGGMRGVPPLASGENPVAAAAHKATRPASLNLSSSDDVKTNVLVTSQNNKVDVGAQRPCWELDDWEFAGAEEDLFVGSGETLPRLVFGGAPSLQEAKDATSELKDALEKVYPSAPKSDGCLDSSTSGSASGLLLLSNSEHLETKACVTAETRANSVPKNGLRAFRLLSENPAAQSVVASIACDPNVWLAVMDNPDLREFLHSQKSAAASSSYVVPLVKESVANVEFPADESVKSSDSLSFLEKYEDVGDRFMNFVQNVKTTVVDMVNSMSDYLNSIFVDQAAGKGSAAVDEGAKTSFMERGMGASLMGLAVMVILVVMLKRN